MRLGNIENDDPFQGNRAKSVCLEDIPALKIDLDYSDEDQNVIVD